MISKDKVEELTGNIVGGVCPFSPKDGVKIYLDESLKKHKTVFPAAGTPNTVIEISIEELETYSNYISWIDVSK